MKKFICHTAVIFIFCTIFSVCPVFAQRSARPENTYHYDKMVLAIQKAGAPYIENGYIVFTAETGPRTFGIAFDFENYSVIHPFEIRKRRDIDDNVTDTLFFYALAIPPKLLELSYRVVIDGLWTCDPLNPDLRYDSESGMMLSHVSIANRIADETEATGKSIRFVYEGEQGQSVKLTGTFTSWDPWIYELAETRPGFYELNVSLPPGTYYYNYMVGMTPMLDKTNPNRAYSNLGRTVSVIEVN